MGGSLSISSNKINMFGHEGLMGSNACMGVGACFASSKPTIVFLGDASVEEDYVLASLSWAAKCSNFVSFASWALPFGGVTAGGLLRRRRSGAKDGGVRRQKCTPHKSARIFTRSSDSVTTSRSSGK